MSSLSSPQHDRHFYLHQRLTDVTLTPDEYREYCYLEALRSGAIANGLLLPDLNLFVTDAMLLQYWRAVDWWPNDLPAHPCPTLAELALQCPHIPDHTPLTLQQLLEARAARVVPVLKEAKRSVVNPNETPAERAKRLNRERQRRHAAAKKRKSVVGVGQGEDAAVRAPVSPVAVQLAETKAAMKAELEQVDAWVREAHQEMLKRARMRREVRAAWDARIAAVKNGDGLASVPPVPV